MRVFATECVVFAALRPDRMTPKQEIVTFAVAGVALVGVVAYECLKKNCQPGWLPSCLAASRNWIHEAVLQENSEEEVISDILFWQALSLANAT
jgi:hypothetical protein